LLGELLKARGVKFDVLSAATGARRVACCWWIRQDLPRDFGDEPLLIARKLQVPVVVAEDRFEAGRFAEERFGRNFICSTMAFSTAPWRAIRHRYCHAQDASDRLLPGGRLREPLSNLRRADAVVLASGASPETFPLQRKTVWRVRRGIRPAKHTFAPNRPFAESPARRIFFCSCARQTSIRRRRLLQRPSRVYRKSIRELVELKEKSEAGGFVTTEKDAVNLGGFLSSLQPLSVVPVKMELMDAANAMNTMLRVIEERKRRA